MIQALDSALQLLQRALAARSLYAHSHPAVRDSEEEAHELLQPALGARGEASFVAVNDRVLWDGEELPSSRSLGHELFAALRRCRADQVTFRRGLERDELRALLDVLADGGSLRSLDRCPHLEFGHLSADDAETAEEILRPHVDRLEQLLGGIAIDQDLDADSLESIALAVTGTVAEHSGALLPLLETKRHDEYTFVHTTNVAVLSGAMAEALGFDRAVTQDVTVAALLHDVGKQVVPAEILTKKEKITDEEMAILRRHPVDGARMLFKAGRSPDLAPIVAYEHHVRADGGGYPQVPRGWRLSLASRIVQLADVYDALRTNRPYRAAVPPPKIREIMRNAVGTVFDASLLAIFFRRVLNRDTAPAQTADMGVPS